MWFSLAAIVYMNIKRTSIKISMLFPSSIDKQHFGKARISKNDPEDQKNIPCPRFGFFGVIDERIDIDMIDKVAQSKTGVAVYITWANGEN